MVNHNKDNLNVTFHALADSTRSEIVRMLAQKRKDYF